jgi:mannosyltransferase
VSTVTAVPPVSGRRGERLPSPTGTVGDRRLPRWGAVALLTALAVALRFAGLGHQSFWFDEAATVTLLHSNLHAVISGVIYNEGTPPLYYLTAWLWSHLVGLAPFGLRSLSALAGVATVPVAYAVGRALASHRVGIVLGALTACNPLLIWYSQEARAYALMVLLTAVALLACVHLRVRPSRGWAIIWAAAAALSLWTHYYAALAIAPQGMLLLARQRRTGMVRRAVEAVLVSGLLVIPLALIQLKRTGSDTWIRLIPLGHRIADLPRTFATGPKADGEPWVLVAVGVIVVFSGWLLARRGDHGERHAGRLGLVLAGAGLAAVGTLIACGVDQLDYRNMLGLWLPCALVISAGLGVRRAGRAGTLAAVALCAVSSAIAVSVALDPSLQRPDWRSVAESVGPRPGRAIFMVNGCEWLPLSLYLPGLHLAPAAGARTTEVDLISSSGQTTWTDVLEDWNINCDPSPVHMRIPRAIAAFRMAGRPRHVNQFTIIRLLAPRPERLSSQMFTAAGLAGSLMVQPPSAPGRPT